MKLTEVQEHCARFESMGGPFGHEAKGVTVALGELESLQATVAAMRTVVTNKIRGLLRAEKLLKGEPLRAKTGEGK